MLQEDGGRVRKDGDGFLAFVLSDDHPTSPKPAGQSAPGHGTKCVRATHSHRPFFDFESRSH